MTAGITGYGAYVPRLRLDRAAAVAAAGWLNNALAGAGRGVRAMAGWDEDSLTMAVEAGRNALAGAARDVVRAIDFASTTPVFAERLNAALIASALRLGSEVRATDSGGSRRAGLTALIRACRDGGTEGETLVVAAEKKPGQAASAASLRQGDAAAALRIGHSGVLARMVASRSETVDFVDLYRGTDHQREHRWEDRWVREEGYGKLLPALVGRLIADSGVDPQRVAHIVAPTPFRGLSARLLAPLGFRPDAVVDPFDETIGDSNTAHPLLMLVAALEAASPGELILVASFAQGAEAALFEVTDAIRSFRPRRSLRALVADGVVEKNYLKFLVFRGLVDWERGPSSERDEKSYLAALYRNRDYVNGLVGLHHAETRQTFFGPEAGYKAQLSGLAFERRSFADSRARIISCSSDYLAPSIDPPACYGVVEFEEGGRLALNFTDARPDELVPGTELEMVFRIHASDGQRGFTRYFWKAAPVRGGAADLRAAA